MEHKELDRSRRHIIQLGHWYELLRQLSDRPTDGWTDEPPNRAYTVAGPQWLSDRSEAEEHDFVSEIDVCHHLRENHPKQIRPALLTVGALCIVYRLLWVIIICITTWIRASNGMVHCCVIIKMISVALLVYPGSGLALSECKQIEGGGSIVMYHWRIHVTMIGWLLLNEFHWIVIHSLWRFI